jgi:23S rRNA pseudouridine1911/1915/1917 synthase
MGSTMPLIHKIIAIPDKYQNLPLRIDLFLVQEFPQYSRTFFQQLITQGQVLLNNKPIVKANILIKSHDIVEITFPETVLKKGLELPENDLGIQVIYQHPDFLIIYKPPYLIVHAPTHYTTTFTLVDWLLHYFKELAHVGQSDRPGIVHRLDKDTSGILIIPRNEKAHAYFSNLFKHRAIEKTYLAVVQGHPPQEGTIEFAITRHPVHKHKMTHIIPAGRESITQYEILQYFSDSALVKVIPLTGRTHQIRVHFAALGYPIIGDTVYGKSSPYIKRQALHAYRLSFFYKDHLYTFVYGLPEDMQELIRHLKSAK